VQKNAELIQQRQPPTVRNCAGYHLRSILSDHRLSLPRLLVGSEGTLAMFTEAVLHTSPLPASRGVALLLFGSMDSAINAVQAIVEQQPSACDLLDRRLLSLGREWDERFARLIPQTAEAGLLVEQTAYTETQSRQRIRMAVDAARRVDAAMRIAAEAYTYDDVEFLWSLPQRVVPNLIRLVGETRPQPFVEDIAVPPEQLREVLRRVQHVLQKHRITASLYAHAASGQVHLRPFLPLPTPNDGPAMESFARELYDVVLSAGGTISGEHGDGLSRTAFLRSQYGPLYRVFREIKDIFDPHNLLNPGKIVSDDSHLTVRHFRPLPLIPAPGDETTANVSHGETATGEGSAASDGVVDLQLNWSATELAVETLRCNGCGVCRTMEAGLRMCPFFRLEPREEASPRAKVNAFRSHLTRFLAPAEMSGEAMKQLASLCFNCKQCQMECPSNVDIPHLMIEAKAQYVAANGLRAGDWALSRAHSFGALGSATAPASNWLLNNGGARWLLEKLFGIASARKLPRFAGRSFLRNSSRGQARRDGAVPKEAVIYFVDHYANYHDTQIAFALVRVLERLGIPVHVPAKQTASGMAMISAGDLDAARELAMDNVRALARFAREGHAVICTEPAAVIALTQEYPRLLDHPDVAAIAAQTQDAGAFLAQRLSGESPGAVFNPLPLKAGYHTPCHTRALYGSPPYLKLLQRIPELNLESIERGCSGMAGAFGLTRDNFETSIAIGRDLMDRMAQSDLQIGVTECSSCKLQMEQGTSTPTVHPIKLLALSMGLIPEARLKLTPNTKRRLTT
jgi:Fe-S oxidoreductase